MKYLIATVAALLFTGAASGKEKTQTIDVSVTESGFVPSSINVKSGTPVALNVTRKTDSTCARQIQVPKQNIKKDLPLNQPVLISLGLLKKGEIRFGCGMDMMVGGQIHVQ